MMKPTRSPLLQKTSDLLVKQVEEFKRTMVRETEAPSDGIAIRSTVNPEPPRRTAVNPLHRDICL